MASGRRFLTKEIQLTRRAWEDVAPELEAWLKRLWDSESNGIPAGFNNIFPTQVTPGSTGHPGNETQGWAAADHDHSVITGPPAGLDNSNVEGSSSGIPRLDHQHRRDLRVKLEGADIATRNALNFEDSPSIDVQISDDPGNDDVVVRLVVNPGQVIPAPVQPTPHTHNEEDVRSRHLHSQHGHEHPHAHRFDEIRNPPPDPRSFRQPHQHRVDELVGELENYARYHAHPHRHRDDEIIETGAKGSHSHNHNHPHSHGVADLRLTGTENVLANQIFGG